MKKIIMGKVYDTETAKEIGYYNDQPTGNISEYLFRKKTGEFFVKRWDVWNGNSILPITYSEAQDWCEKHCSAEQYAAVFGEPDEGSEDVTLGLRISAAASAKLKREASKRGIPQGALLERWIMNA